MDYADLNPDLHSYLNTRYT